MLTINEFDGFWSQLMIIGFENLKGLHSNMWLIEIYHKMRAIINGIPYDNDSFPNVDLSKSSMLILDISLKAWVKGSKDPGNLFILFVHELEWD